MKTKPSQVELGDYAVNTAAGCPWIAVQAAPRAGPPKKRQNRPNVKLTHVIFDQMANRVADPFWVGELRRMAAGRMRKNFKLAGPELTFRGRGGKVDTILLPQEPERVEELIEFFHRCGIFSIVDEEHNGDLLRARSSHYQTKVLGWPDIARNGFLLERALASFAGRKVAEVGAPASSVPELITLLRVAAAYHVLTSSTVKITNSEISDILVLSYDPERRAWDVDFGAAKDSRPPAKRRAKAKRAPKPRHPKGARLSSTWISLVELMLSSPEELRSRRLRKKPAGRSGEGGSQWSPEATITEAAAEPTEVTEVTDLTEEGVAENAEASLD